MTTGPSLAFRAQTGGVIAPVARARLLGTAGVAMLALVLTSGRYGYHRDELYFIAAGAHPAWGYPDQPLLVPLLARAMDLLAPGSLLVLRAPAILACGVTTVTTGLLAREFGGGRRAQWLSAACWASGAVCLVTGHFLTTTTYDVCATAVVALLIARVRRTGDERWWLPAGPKSTDTDSHVMVRYATDSWSRSQLASNCRRRSITRPSAAVETMYHGQGPITLSSELCRGLARRYM